MGWLTSFRYQRDAHLATLRDGAGFAVRPGETLLEGALRAGLQAPHDCRSGACGTCRCRILDGQPRSLVDRSYVLPPQDVASGVFLACQTEICSDVSVEWPMPDAAASPCIATVTDLARLAPKVWRVTLTVPRAVRACPGQYIALSADLATGREVRQFSLVDVEAQDGEQTLLRIDVARRTSGAVSPWLTSEAALGVSVRVDGPSGSCIPDESLAPLVCVGAGSGIGAAAGVLQSSRRANGARPTALLSYASSADDLYGPEPEEGPMHLTRAWATDPCSRRGIRAGRAPAGLLEALEDMRGRASPAAVHAPLVLLYGPAAFIASCGDELARCGLSPQRIRSDAYRACGAAVTC